MLWISWLHPPSGARPTWRLLRVYGPDVGSATPDLLATSRGSGSVPPPIPSSDGCSNQASTRAETPAAFRDELDPSPRHGLRSRNGVARGARTWGTRDHGESRPPPFDDLTRAAPKGGHAVRPGRVWCVDGAMERRASGSTAQGRKARAERVGSGVRAGAARRYDRSDQRETGSRAEGAVQGMSSRPPGRARMARVVEP